MIAGSGDAWLSDRFGQIVREEVGGRWRRFRSRPRVPVAAGECPEIPEDSN